MKFEKEVYCSYCGYAIAEMRLTVLDAVPEHKGSHLAKLEVVAVCDDCARGTTAIFNNTQDFTKPRMIIERTNDPVHDVIQAEGNKPTKDDLINYLQTHPDVSTEEAWEILKKHECPTCGGSMPQGYCAACRALT